MLHTCKEFVPQRCQVWLRKENTLLPKTSAPVRHFSGLPSPPSTMTIRQHLLLLPLLLLHLSRPSSQEPELRRDLPETFRSYYLLRPDRGDFRLDYERGSGRAEFVIRSVGLGGMHKIKIRKLSQKVVDSGRNNKFLPHYYCNEILIFYDFVGQPQGATRPRDF